MENKDADIRMERFETLMLGFDSKLDDIKETIKDVPDRLTRLEVSNELKEKKYNELKEQKDKEIAELKEEIKELKKKDEDQQKQFIAAVVSIVVMIIGSFIKSALGI